MMILLGTMPACGAASLKTQLGVLGRSARSYIQIKTDSWTQAQRLILNVTSIGNNSTQVKIKADAVPITLRVDMDNLIGEGSMQKAYKAEVKTIEKDGSEKFFDFIAKI